MGRGSRKKKRAVKTIRRGGERRRERRKQLRKWRKRRGKIRWGGERREESGAVKQRKRETDHFLFPWGRRISLPCLTLSLPNLNPLCSNRDAHILGRTPNEKHHVIHLLTLILQLPRRCRDGWPIDCILRSGCEVSIIWTYEPVLPVAILTGRVPGIHFRTPDRKLHYILWFIWSRQQSQHQFISEPLRS